MSGKSDKGAELMRRPKKKTGGRSSVLWVEQKERALGFATTQAEAIRTAHREQEEELAQGGKQGETRQLYFRTFVGSPFVHGYAIPVRFIDPEGHFKVQDIADWFGLSKVQLADTVGLQVETFHRAKRTKSAKTQSRVREMLEIVGRVAEWAGGKDQAMAWYRAEPLPAFGGRTAEALVKEGKATAVRDFLDHIALGGFA